MTRVVRAIPPGSPLRPARVPAAASRVRRVGRACRSARGIPPGKCAREVPVRPPPTPAPQIRWSGDVVRPLPAATGVTLPARRRVVPARRRTPAPPILTGTYRKVQQQSAKISIDASKDRARLDARSNAQAERLKAAAEAEACRSKRWGSGRDVSTPRARLAATNWLMKQKRVMDLLHRTRKPMSTAELHRRPGWRWPSRSWEMLRSGTRCCLEVRVVDVRRHSLRDRREMLALMHKHPDGVLEEDVVDAYQGAVEDAAALVGRAGHLPGRATRESDVLRSGRCARVHVDEDVSAAFHGVAIRAHDPDWDQALRQIGVEPAPRRAHAARGGDVRRSGTPGKVFKKRRGEFRAREASIRRTCPSSFKAPQVGRLDGETRRNESLLTCNICKNVFDSCTTRKRFLFLLDVSRLSARA